MVTLRRVGESASHESRINGYVNGVNGYGVPFAREAARPASCPSRRILLGALRRSPPSPASPFSVELRALRVSVVRRQPFSPVLRRSHPLTVQLASALSPLNSSRRSSSTAPAHRCAPPGVRTYPLPPCSSRLASHSGLLPRAVTGPDGELLLESQDLEPDSGERLARCRAVEDRASEAWPIGREEPDRTKPVPRAGRFRPLVGPRYLPARRS